MNRIHFFIAFVFFLFTLFACGNEEMNLNPTLEFSSTSLKLGADGGNGKITVHSSVDWAVDSIRVDWISLDINNGSAGIYEINVAVDKNSSSEGRSYKLRFYFADKMNFVDIIQSAMPLLRFDTCKNIQLSCNDTLFAIDVDKNISYKLDFIPHEVDWLRIGNKLGNNLGNDDISSHLNISNGKLLYIDVDANFSGTTRCARVVIENTVYNLSDTLNIIQVSGEKNFYDDKDYVALQKADVGGVDLILMGDGFTKDDMSHNGEYIKVMNQTMEYFFSIEPYKSYRKYFNVYAVIAESDNDRCGSGETKFKTKFGGGTAISCDDETVFEYAEVIKELNTHKPISVVLPLNIDKYAGTAYMYANGNSIALCPMSTEQPPYDFEGIIHHEAGGHGFGLLCDEYVYYDRAMPESRIKEIKEWQEMGFYHNLDFTDNLQQIRWKDFIGLPEYSDVGAFEGGYEYQYGVWRPEENSCMNNNIPYFNVQSRWSIVKRIMTISGTDFSISDFMENDVVNKPVGSRSENMPENFIPLGEPVMIKNMK